MGRNENTLKTNDAVCTPPEVFLPALKALGIESFDLDPCSHPNALVPTRRRVLLPEYREKLEGRQSAIGVLYGDGLMLPWRGDVWLNPPYSHLQYLKRFPWIDRLSTEATRGVAFLPSRTSAGWWHEKVLRNEHADILVQLRGRVKHVGEKWGSPFQQVLVGYGVFLPAGDEPRWGGPSVELARWRDAFQHPHKAFVSSLREMRR